MNFGTVAVQPRE